MASVTITLEDSVDGKVKVVCTPSFETMMTYLTSGNQLTSAQGYAVHMLNAVRHASKQMGPDLKITIPVIGQ